MLRGRLDSPVRNAVVLTGDEHVHHANELELDDRPAGTELVTTSITSGGDGDGDSGDGDDSGGSGGDENPHIRYREDRRGYLLTRFTPAELRADFRVVEQVSRPDAPVRTSATFVVPDGGALTRP